MLSIMGRGKLGTVIIRDERSDGSWILLVCEEIPPDDRGGVLGLPTPEVYYPAPRTRKKVADLLKVDEQDQFQLEVDISEMPQGELQFDSRRFIGQAVAESEVTSTARITPENAGTWGYRGAVA